MKIRSHITSLVAVSLALMLALGLAGCSNDGANENEEDELVAATVNGTDILEKDVQAFIDTNKNYIYAMAQAEEGDEDALELEDGELELLDDDEDDASADTESADADEDADGTSDDEDDGTAVAAGTDTDESATDSSDTADGTGEVSQEAIEASWKEFKEMYGYTDNSFREEVVETFIRNELIKEKARSYGIEVTEADVNEKFEVEKESYGEYWEEVIESWTEEQFKDDIETELWDSRLQEAMVEDGSLSITDPDEDTITQFISSYAYEYDGMSRSSRILMSSDDKETAEAVLKQAIDGEDFAELAKTHSADTETATNGGDMGWDFDDELEEAYLEALYTMEKGEVCNELIETSDGYNIIHCSDSFLLDEDEDTADASKVPAEIQEVLKQDQLAMLASEVFEDHYSSILRADADVTINENPYPNAEEDEAEANSTDEAEAGDDTTADNDDATDLTADGEEISLDELEADGGEWVDMGDDDDDDDEASATL